MWRDTRSKTSRKSCGNKMPSMTATQASFSKFLSNMDRWSEGVTWELVSCSVWNRDASAHILIHSTSWVNNVSKSPHLILDQICSNFSFKCTNNVLPMSIIYDCFCTLNVLAPITASFSSHSNMKLESAASSSLEDRVKRNIHSIQRTPASLDNFMKRWSHNTFILQTDWTELILKAGK